MRRFSEVLLAGCETACRSTPELAQAGRDHVVQVPQRVFRQPGRPWGHDAADREPVAIRMASVGHGAGDVRLRQYLWMWAITSTRRTQSSAVRRSTGDWAVLLNLLPDRYVTHQQKRAQAARRVARAQRWLVTNNALEQSRRGELVLLDPDCTSRPYVAWTDTDLVEREASLDRYRMSFGAAFDQRRAGDYWEDPPLQVPSSLWVNGTISALSGAALASLLVLYDLERRLEVHGDPILPPKSRPYEYPLSQQVWRRGLLELEAFGCAARSAGPVMFGPSDHPGSRPSRHRNRWKLNYTRLEAEQRDRY